jgi:hypothetical protein
MPSDELQDKLTEAVTTFLTEIRGLVADALKEAESAVRPAPKKEKKAKAKA